MSGWMRLKNTIGNHPKHLQVPGDASWLWACGIGYCRENLTDGFIPASALIRLGNFPKPQPLAAALVRVGLWVAVEGGYRINDYDAMNLSKQEVQSKLDADAKRKRDGRARGVRADADDGVRSDGDSGHTESVRAYISHSSLLTAHSQESGEGVGEGDADWLWGEWRRVMARRVSLSAMPKAGDIPTLVAIVAAVPDKAVLVAALERFEALPDAERKTRGIKALSLGFFKMALPDLVAAGPAPRVRCLHNHQPPCQGSDAVCTERYLADLRKVPA